MSDMMRSFQPHSSFEQRSLDYKRPYASNSVIEVTAPPKYEAVRENSQNEENVSPNDGRLYAIHYESKGGKQVAHSSPFKKTPFSTKTRSVCMKPTPPKEWDTSSRAGFTSTGNLLGIDLRRDIGIPSPEGLKVVSVTGATSQSSPGNDIDSLVIAQLAKLSVQQPPQRTRGFISIQEEAKSLTTLNSNSVPFFAVNPLGQRSQTTTQQQQAPPGFVLVPIDQWQNPVQSQQQFAAVPAPGYAGPSAQHRVVSSALPQPSQFQRPMEPGLQHGFAAQSPHRPVRFKSTYTPKGYRSTTVLPADSHYNAAPSPARPPMRLNFDHEHDVPSRPNTAPPAVSAEFDSAGAKGKRGNRKTPYKTFYNKLRQVEACEGLKAAHDFAQAAIAELPPDMHWRLFMELADLSKRMDNVENAREWYRRVTACAPATPQGWLERAKLEEEEGNFKMCDKLISMGLEQCPFHDSLLVRKIRIMEKLGMSRAVRDVLGSLDKVSVNRVWRVVLEGALFEARQGQPTTARKVFKYLFNHAPAFGPIWLECTRFEQRREEYEQAEAVARRGIEINPKYGPLWFLRFQVAEQVLMKKLREHNIPQTANGGESAQLNEWLGPLRQMYHDANKTLASELHWKTKYEEGLMEARFGYFRAAQQCFDEAEALCPSSLKWKVWISRARVELRCNNPTSASKSLEQALLVAPDKTKNYVLMDRARLEAFQFSLTKARAVFQNVQSQNNLKQEWKLLLEGVTMEIRYGNMSAALKQAAAAVEVHDTAGRLWALFVQLKQLEGIDSQMQTFLEAVKRVPKSGEVWTEGARLCMNPSSPHFDLKKAEEYLNFAMEFTPQYGDSFVEFLRLRSLQSYGTVRTDEDSEMYNRVINADPNYGALWQQYKASASTRMLGQRVAHEARESSSMLLVPHAQETIASVHRGAGPSQVLREASMAVEQTHHKFRQMFQFATSGCWKHGAAGDSMPMVVMQQFRAWPAHNPWKLDKMYPQLEAMSAADRFVALFTDDNTRGS